MPTQYQHLGHRAFWILLLQKSSGAFVLLLALAGLGVLRSVVVLDFLPTYLLPAIAGALSLLFVLSIIAAAATTYAQYSAYRFALDEDAVRVQRGIFYKKEIAIPYRQIQDVDIERPFLFQLLGASKLQILSSGTEGREGTADSNDVEGVLPILDAEAARALQTELLRRADVEKVVNVNERTGGQQG